jgi:hypothetical protein
MSNYTGAIDISRMPDLLDLVEEVKETRQPKALTRDNKVVALLSPVGTETFNSAYSREALTRSLAAIGSWSDLDVTNVTRKIAEWRDIGSRP